LTSCEPSEGRNHRACVESQELYDFLELIIQIASNAHHDTVDIPPVMRRRCDRLMTKNLVRREQCTATRPQRYHDPIRQRRGGAS